MKKVFIVNGSWAYLTLFNNLGFNTQCSLQEADLVCFTGGADVTPSYYGDKKHPKTFNDPFRDEEETKVFAFCIDNNIPMVGICRGGQFLNVMSGGRMYQDVEKHTRSHNITDKVTGEVVYVTSTHHQMMMPSEQAEIVAVSYLGGAREWYEGQVLMRDKSEEDIEVVYYAHNRALCFQPHPELYASEHEGMQQYFRSLIKRYLEI